MKYLGGANPDLRGVQAPAEPAPALDVQSIILQQQFQRQEESDWSVQPVLHRK